MARRTYFKKDFQVIYSLRSLTLIYNVTLKLCLANISIKLKIIPTKAFYFSGSGRIKKYKICDPTQSGNKNILCP